LRLIDKSMTKSQFLDQLSQSEALLKSASAKIEALNLATQEAIKTAVSSGAEIKTVRDSLRFSKKLYTIIHEQSRLLHREGQSVLDSWPETPSN
jgi:DNA helicase IV